MTPAEQFTFLQDALETALSLDGDEQEAFILSTTNDNPVLEKKLRAMLEFSLREEDSVHSLISLSAKAIVSRDRSGEVIGKFKILSQLGQGGMGEVYLAERVDQAFNQQVAIKIIRQDIEDEQLHANFIRERQILADLNHPNICSLIDGGTTEDGELYLVMEYIEGLCLDEYCLKKNLTTKEKTGLFIKICDAVSSAHQQLIVHCDLKPSNIIVTNSGEPKLLDFGIANILSKNNDTENRIAISYDYASPELLRGEAPRLACDVYALGVILSQIISGQRPYQLKETTLEKVKRYRSERTATIPSDALNKNVSSISESITNKSLKYICEKASAYDYHERYNTVDELSKELWRFNNKFPIQARRQSPFYSLSCWINRNRFSATAIVVLISTLVTAGFRENNLRIKAEFELEKSQRISNFLIQLFEDANPLQNKGQQFTAKQLLDRGRHTITSQGTDEFYSPLLQTIAVAYAGLGEYTTASELFTKIIKEENLSELHDKGQLAKLYGRLGTVESSLDHFEVAEQWFDKSFTLYAAIPEGNSKDFYKFKFIFANLLVKAERFEEAKQIFDSLLDSYNANPHQFDEQTFLDIRIGLATIDNRSGDFSKALSVLTEILPIQEKLTGKLNDTYLFVLNEIIMINLRLAPTSDFEALILDYLSLSEQFYPPRHRGLFNGRHNASAYYVGHERYEDAKKLLLKNEREFEKFDFEDERFLANTYQLLAAVYGGSEQYKKAIEYYRSSLKIRQSIYDENHQNIFTLYYNLALSSMSSGNYSDARLFMDKVMVLTNKENFNPFFKAIFKGANGQILLVEKDFHQAKEQLTSSLAMLNRMIPTPHLRKTYILESLAHYHKATGSLDDSLAFINKALDMAERLSLQKKIRYAKFQLFKAELLISLKRAKEAKRLVTEANDSLSKKLGRTTKTMLQVENLLAQFNNKSDDVI